MESKKRKSSYSILMTPKKAHVIVICQVKVLYVIIVHQYLTIINVYSLLRGEEHLVNKQISAANKTINLFRLLFPFPSAIRPLNISVEPDGNTICNFFYTQQLFVTCLDLTSFKHKAVHCDANILYDKL